MVYASARGSACRSVGALNRKPVPKPFRTPRTMPARPLLAQPHGLRARFMYRSKTLSRATRLFLSWQTRMRLFWLL